MKNAKKIIVCLFSLLMIAAMIVPMTAADANALAKSYDAAAAGDLLYAVKFGQTTGCYKSAEMSRDAANTGTIAVSADGKEVTIKVTQATSKRLWYGGVVEGLKLGTGYKYTITFQLKNDNSDTTVGTGNNGFYFHTDAAATTYTSSFGAYGNLSIDTDPFLSLMRGGSKAVGTVSDGANYVKVKDVLNIDPAPDADGFVNYAFEIDGWTYTVYINGKKFDSTTVAEADQLLADSFGIVYYTYSSGGTLKNVNIYKGLTISSPVAAVTTTTQAAATTTKAAATTATAAATTAAATTTKAAATTTTTKAPTTTPTTVDNTMIIVSAALLAIAAAAVIMSKKRAR